MTDIPVADEATKKAVEEAGLTDVHWHSKDGKLVPFVPWQEFRDDRARLEHLNRRAMSLTAQVHELHTHSVAFLGDDKHLRWADYVATNLLDALEQVPDTGDWHGALRAWCNEHKTGKIEPNRKSRA